MHKKRRCPCALALAKRQSAEAWLRSQGRGPGGVGNLYKAVRPRVGRGPGSLGLYESPHGSTKSFTLGWFAEAPLRPSWTNPAQPSSKESCGVPEALGPSRGRHSRRGGGGRTFLTPNSQLFPSPQVWFQNRRSKERRMKQLSALGARRHAFFRSPRRMRPLGGRLDESEMLGSTPYTYYGGKGHLGTLCCLPRRTALLGFLAFWATVGQPLFFSHPRRKYTKPFLDRLISTRYSLTGTS